jgi:hypothetical protein
MGLLRWWYLEKNSATCGGTCIPTSDTTRTSHIASTLERKVWDGGSTCVSLVAYPVLLDADHLFDSTVVLSERIKDKVKMCEIRGEIWGASDHCPIMMDVAEDAIL